METLTALGTGKAIVQNCYNTCFLLNGGDGLFLVDGGGGSGILRQLRLAGVNFPQIHEAFLTHAHTDHIFGMVWVLRMITSAMLNGSYNGIFRLYSHEDALAAVKTIASLTLSKKSMALFGDKVQLVPVQDGETRTIADYDVNCFDILSTKMKQFAFSLQLHNGQKLAFMGDEPASPEREAYMKDADWALCEAFCLDGDKDRFKPYEKHHATVRDEAMLAERLGVRRLVLWHTEDSCLDTRKELYTKEARQFFGGDVYIPDDLERIILDA